MPTRMILPLILGMLVLPVFPQDEPPPNTGDASELSDNIAERMKKAEEGDVSTQLELGRRYEFGVGVSEDYKEAARWYRAAAEQGHASAQYNLGVMHSRGTGFPQDYKEAFRWYQRAANRGDAPAQYNLGVMYVEGTGFPQDYKEAIRWYRAAAEQGHGNAQNNLGFMYDKGQGVAQDYIQAHLWLNLAASTGGDGEDREQAAKNRDSIAEKMTSAQIAEAQRLAREWKPKTGSQ